MNAFRKPIMNSNCGCGNARPNPEKATPTSSDTTRSLRNSIKRLRDFAWSPHPTTSKSRRGRFNLRRHAGSEIIRQNLSSVFSEASWEKQYLLGDGYGIGHLQEDSGAPRGRDHRQQRGGQRINFHCRTSRGRKTSYNFPSPLSLGGNTHEV